MTERSGLLSAHQMVPYIVLLPSEQTGFVEWTVAEGVSTFSKALKICTYPLLLQLPNKKNIIYGRTKWNWSVDNETSDICWCDESLKLVNE